MKVAIITGGASGIGGAAVDLFLKDGYHVLGVDLNAREESDTLAWGTGSVDEAVTWEAVAAASNPDQFLSTHEQRNPLVRLLTSEEVAELPVDYEDGSHDRQDRAPDLIAHL